MPVVLRPTTELVACAWIAGIEGVTSDMVATTLPDSTSWSTNGFIQVYTVGGSPKLHNPLRQPVLNVDCWAVSPNSNKAPWGKANYLAELVWDASMVSPGRVVTLPGSYPQARVLGVDVLQEPRRVPSDQAGYARYQFDMQIHWAAV